MSKLSVEKLIECLKEASVTKEILVPDEDYYARRTDFTRENICYIDASKLREAIALALM